MRTFTINFNGEPHTILQRARMAAQQNGAVLQGDTNRGIFYGSGVEGSYTVAGQTLTITIQSKPFFAPWEMVEAQLRNFFR